MKRFLSLALAIMLMLTFAATVSAEQAVNPRYLYITETNTGIRLNSSTGAVICEASARTQNNMEIQIECKLQRFNNSKWNNVKTWTASGTGSASISKSWSVPGGYDYRIYATYKVYDSNGNCVETVNRQDSVSVPAS